MEKVIKIGKTPVKLNNNIAWTMEYRDQFGTDVIQDHIPMLATIAETVAAIASEAGTEDLELSAVLAAIEGRALDLMMPLMTTEIMTVITNVTWAMAKAANEDIDPPKEWAKQFDEWPLDVIVPTIYDMALSGFISSKNRKRLRSLAETIQPSHLIQSSSQVLNEG